MRSPTSINTLATVGAPKGLHGHLSHCIDLHYIFTNSCSVRLFISPIRMMFCDSHAINASPTNPLRHGSPHFDCKSRRRRSPTQHHPHNHTATHLTLNSSPPLDNDVLLKSSRHRRNVNLPSQHPRLKPPLPPALQNRIDAQTSPNPLQQEIRR